MTAHASDGFMRDDMAFLYALCTCGWNSPPCPSLDEATDFFTAHLASEHSAPR